MPKMYNTYHTVRTVAIATLIVRKWQTVQQRTICIARCTSIGDAILLCVLTASVPSSKCAHTSTTCLCVSMLSLCAIMQLIGVPSALNMLKWADRSSKPDEVVDGLL
jgi:hypothetical protein